MKIINTKVGVIHTNCYIIFDENTKDAVIVDPGDKGTYLVELLKEHELKLNYILLTHGHFDHILAVKELQEKTGAKLVIHKNDVYQIADDVVNEHSGRYIRGKYESGTVDVRAVDGTEIKFGSLTATYIHTPGHTRGSSCIKIENALFTGDTLFAGECGRCDFEGGSFEKMLESLKKLANLEGNLSVFPGHEGFSDLDTERRSNPYVLQALSK